MDEFNYGPTLQVLLGGEDEIHFEGRAYKFRQPNVGEMLRFSGWLKRRAIETAAQAAEYLPPDVHARLESRTVRECATGVFDFYSEAGLEATSTFAGKVKLLHLILSANHPEVSEEVAERMLLHKGKEILAVLGTAGEDPQSPKVQAVLAGLGLPAGFLSGLLPGSGSPPTGSPGTKSSDSPPANSGTSSASG